MSYANTMDSKLKPNTHYPVFVYGLFSYAIGVAGLLAIILAMGNIIPLGKVVIFTDSNLIAGFVNFGLLSLFGIQHTIMARPRYKNWFNKRFNSACDRSNFVLATGIVSILIVTLWQPMGEVIWQVEGTLYSALIWAGFLIGWGYLLAATFAINHWDLFGLRQTWLAATGNEYTPLQFKETWMYRYSRHPIMLGALIGLWVIPTMTGAHLALAILFTVYMFIGIGFEERDLLAVHGESYRRYKNRVGMFLTINKPSRW